MQIKMEKLPIFRTDSHKIKYFAILRSVVEMTREPGLTEPSTEVPRAELGINDSVIMMSQVTLQLTLQHLVRPEETVSQLCDPAHIF